MNKSSLLRRCWCLLFFFLFVSASSSPHQAIQLLRPNAAHSGLEIVPEGLTFLKELTTPVAFVGVVGDLRSGKSFFLNVLLSFLTTQALPNNDPSSSPSSLPPSPVVLDAFPIGTDLRQKTLGVWLVPTDIVSDADGAQIILVDTEGFGAEQSLENYDVKVFAVTAALSSHLLYNTIKTMSQETADNILLRCIRTSQHFKTQIEHSSSSSSSLSVPPSSFSPLVEQYPQLLPFFDQIFAKLTWVIQDFNLGGDVEQHLFSMTGSGRDKETRSLIQQVKLDKVFHDGISAFGLYFPSQVDHLHDLSQIAVAELLPSFRSGMSKLIKRVFGGGGGGGDDGKGRKKNGISLEAKKIGSKAVTGETIATLLPFIIDSLNSDDFEEKPTDMEKYITEAALQSIRRLAKVFEIKLSKVVADGTRDEFASSFASSSSSSSSVPPLSAEELNKSIADLREEAMQLYRKEWFYREELVPILHSKLDKSVKETSAALELQTEQFVSEVCPLWGIEKDEEQKADAGIDAAISSLECFSRYYAKNDQYLPSTVCKALRQVASRVVEAAATAARKANDCMDRGFGLNTKTMNIIGVIVSQQQQQLLQHDQSSLSLSPSVVAHFSDLLTAVWKDFIARNEAEVNTLFTSSMEQLFESYISSQKSSISPLPSTESNIRSQQATIADRVLRQVEEKLKNFQDSPRANEAVNALKERIASSQSTFLQDNEKLLDSKVNTVCIQEIAKISTLADEDTLFTTVPNLFQSRAVEVVLPCIISIVHPASTITESSLSPSDKTFLQNAAERWINRNCEEANEKVQHRFRIALSILAGALIALWLLRRLFYFIRAARGYEDPFSTSDSTEVLGSAFTKME